MYRAFKKSCPTSHRPQIGRFSVEKLIFSPKSINFGAGHELSVALYRTREETSQFCALTLASISAIDGRCVSILVILELNKESANCILLKTSFYTIIFGSHSYEIICDTFSYRKVLMIENNTGETKGLWETLTCAPRES